MALPAMLAETESDACRCEINKILVVCCHSARSLSYSAWTDADVSLLRYGKKRKA